jgi:ABC-2 type transport system permease protein
MSAGAAAAVSSTGVRRRAFLALCERDLWVTIRHEPVAFLAQSLLQPIFFLFVFGRVLPEIGAAGRSYGTQLMPGVMGLTLVLTALQNTALPLVIEFSFTKEIEDRLLAPLPVAAVGVQKMVIAALRGVIAALLILPLAALILPGGIDLSNASWIGLAAVLVFGSLAGGAMGLVLGTAVPPNRISVAFAIVLNPLTYVSEGMRAALTSLDHLGVGWIALGLAASLVVFGALGVRGFNRRAVD